MYFVYVISSSTRNYIYVGLTDNLERRIPKHNKGYERTTRPYRLFEILITENFATRVEVREREKYLKTGIGKEYLRRIRDNKSVSLSTDQCQ